MVLGRLRPQAATASGIPGHHRGRTGAIVDGTGLDLGNPLPPHPAVVSHHPVRLPLGTWLQAARRARLTMRDFAFGFYFRAQGLTWWQRMRCVPVLFVVECLLFRGDALAERAKNVDLDPRRNDDHRTVVSYQETFNRSKARLIKLLHWTHAYNEAVARQIVLGEEFLYLENKATASGVTTHDEAIRLADLRSFDMRLLHGMTFALLRRPVDQRLVDLLWPVEALFDIGDDLVTYHEDLANGHYNTYDTFVRLYGAAAPDRLREEIARYEQLFHAELAKYPANRQVELAAICAPLFQTQVRAFPEPHLRSAPGRFTRGDLMTWAPADLELVLTAISGVAWTIVYISGIRVGLRQHTYAIPVAALALNLAWESIYAPLDLNTALSGPGPIDTAYLVQGVISLLWALADVVIVYTFLVFGRADLPSFVTQGMFALGSALLFGAAYVVQWLFIVEFGVDTASRYSAFLQNLLMSGLFIAMFMSRRGPRGQTLTIAVAKWVGTLAATVIYGIIEASPFILGLGLLCCIFDLVYIGLVAWARRRSGDLTATTPTPAAEPVPA